MFQRSVTHNKSEQKIKIVSKEIEEISENQMESLELKNITKIYKTVQGFNIKIEKGKTHELEDRPIEITHSE
jgi:ribosomal protein S9